MSTADQIRMAERTGRADLLAQAAGTCQVCAGSHRTA